MISERGVDTKMETDIVLQLLSLSSPVFLLTQDGQISFLNQSAKNLLNTSDQLVHDTYFIDLLQDPSRETWEKVCNTLFNGEIWEGELILSILGKEYTLLVKAKASVLQGQPVILVGCEDLTEKKLLQQHLLKFQRIEGSGFLVTGAAHDMNNVLLLFMMLVRVLRSRLADAHSQALFNMVEAGSKRGSALLKQMLCHARGIEKQHVEVNLKDLVEELVGLCLETFPKNVRLEKDVVHTVAPIWGNPSQMHQVILNLLINARDAVEEGGLINVKVETIDLDSQSHHHAFLSGHYTVLTVKDSGAGIPKEVMERMYEPYFTTKPEGKGTGLGLPTVMTITKSHSGILEVVSEVGKGTTFTLYFPAIITPPSSSMS